MTRLDRGTMPIKIAREFGVVVERNEFPVRAERINDPEPAPLHLAGQNIAGHSNWKLAIRLDIKFVKRRDEHLIRARGDADPNLASRFFKGRIFGLKATEKAELIGRTQHPGLGAVGGVYDFRHSLIFETLRSGHRLSQALQPARFNGRTHGDASRPGFLAANNDNRRISDHVREKRVRVDHIDKASKMKI